MGVRSAASLWLAAVASGCALLLAACGPAHGASPARPAPSSVVASATSDTYAADLATSKKGAAANTAPLCGFPLTACPQGSYGRVGATPPKAATVGSFVELDVSKYFQADGVVAPQAVNPPPKGGTPPYKGTGKFNLEGAGQGLSVGDIPVPFAPNTGTWQVPIRYKGHTLQVPFLMPAGGVGVKDAFDVQKQITIAVPPGKYYGVWILELGINGGGTADLTASYGAGLTREYPMNFQPDCNPATVAAPQFWVYAAPYFLTPTGVSTSCRYLFADAVPINPDHTLTGLTLPATAYEQTNKLVVMAMTLQKAA